MKISMWRPDRITLVLAGILFVAMSGQSQQTGKVISPIPDESATGTVAVSSRDHTNSIPGPQHRKMVAAIAMARNGDFHDAIGLFDDVLKHDPNLAEAHYDLGLALLGAGSDAETWAKAMLQFRAAIRIRQKYPEARNMLGVGMLVSGDPEGSVKELKIAALEAPGMPEVHLNLGKALAAVGQWKGASGEFRKAIELRHSYPEAEAQLGNALLNQGETTAAASAFLGALRGNPDIESAHYGLARTLKAEGKSTASRVEFAEARDLLQRKSDAVMSSNLSNQSLGLAAHGEASQAEKMARQAVELEPDNWMAVYNYGLLLADTGNLHSGLDEIRKAISFMPMRRSLYLTMAQMQKQIGDTKTAECTLWRSDHLLGLAATSGAGSVQTQKTATCLASEGRFAFGASFGDVDEHRAFANYLSAKGDLLGASGELLYSAKLAPSRPEIRYDLAIVWLQMGKLADAELELRKVLILSPQSPKAHFALGAIMVQRKDFKGAEEQLHQALHLNPGNKEAQSMLDEIAGRNKH